MIPLSDAPASQADRRSDEIIDVVRYESEAMWQVTAADQQRESDIAEMRRIGACRWRQALRLLAKLIWRASRKNDEVRGRSVRSGRLRRSFLHNDMRISAAEAE